MERQNQIANRIAELMLSFPSQRWGGGRQSVIYNWVRKEFPDSLGLRAHDAAEAAYKVFSNFESWRSNGYGSAKPTYDEATWARFRDPEGRTRFERNEGTWGVKLPLEPHNPEWFRCRTGEYQDKLLEQVVNGDGHIGSSEIKEYDRGYVLNQAVTLPETGQTDYAPVTAVGVDMNLTNLAVLAVHTDDEIEQVELFSGDKVGHHRRRLRQMRSDLQETGNQAKVKELKGLEQRFCEQENHRISKQVVEIAEQYENPVIVMEQLKGIRKRVNEQRRSSEFTAALNSWTFAELRSMIEYKAAKEGIKTKTVGAAYTSKTCNKCGEHGTRPYERNWSRFYCEPCDYEVNADVNAAINIAQRGT